MAGSTNASTWRSNATQQPQTASQTTSREPTASSSSVEEDWTTVDDPRYYTIIIGYEQGTDHPLTMNRDTAAQAYPRHAAFLQGDDNPYRLPGIPSRQQSRQQEGGRDIEADWVEVELAGAGKMQRSDGYGSLDKPILLRGEGDSFRLAGVANELKSGVQAKEDRQATGTSEGTPTGTRSRPTQAPHDMLASEPPRKSSVRLQYMDTDTLARLEGKDRFPREAEGDTHWTHIDSDDAVLGAAGRSKFSDSSSAAPWKPFGVLRSLSKKVKGVLRRPSTARRGEESGPVEVQDLHPARDGPAILHPDLKAIPLEEAQGRFLTVNDVPQNPGQPDTNRYPHALKPRTPKSKRPAVQQLAGRSPTSQTQRPRQIKIVGSPDRMTEFGDFIDLSDSDTITGVQQAHRLDHDDSDFEILEIKPLRPGSKARPNRESLVKNQLPPPAKVTSMHDWRMSDDYPTVQALFDQIDKQIADADIPETEKPAANREAYRWNGILEGQASGGRGVDCEEDEPEPVMDTFVHTGHSSWYVTSRPDASSVKSEYRRIERAPQMESRDTEEAVQLRKLLMTLTAGVNE